MRLTTLAAVCAALTMSVAPAAYLVDPAAAAPLPLAVGSMALPDSGLTTVQLNTRMGRFERRPMMKHRMMMRDRMMTKRKMHRRMHRM